MLKAFLRLLISAAVLFSATAGGLALSAAAQETFARSSVVIETAGGGKFRFNVEMAETMAQQAQGLMFRRQMAADAGMLFPYAAPQVAAFWMKNTFIPLDMLFIAADGRISHIHPNAAPQSEASISSKGPVKAVLELNGGLAARLGVRVGDVVRHAVFGNAS
jgi:uncharacterized protein